MTISRTMEMGMADMPTAGATTDGRGMETVAPCRR
jgi:hypothetical protein